MMNDNFLQASLNNKQEHEKNSKKLEKKKREQKIKDILYLLLLVLLITAIILMLYFILRQKKHENVEEQPEPAEPVETGPLTDPSVPRSFKVKSVTFYSTDDSRYDAIADLPDFINNWISAGFNATVYQQDYELANGERGTDRSVFYQRESHYLSQNGTVVDDNTTVDVFFDENGNIRCEIWCIYGENEEDLVNEMHLFDENGNETQVVRFEQNNFQGATEWRDCIVVTDEAGNTYYAIEGQNNYETIKDNINSTIENSRNRRLTNTLTHVANKQPDNTLRQGNRKYINDNKGL